MGRKRYLKMDNEIKVTLVRHDRPGTRGYKYDAIYKGEVIACSRVAEFSACRALKEMGLSGRVGFYRPDRDYCCMRMTIEGGSKLTVFEPDKGNLSFQKYKPHPIFNQKAA